MIWALCGLMALAVVVALLWPLLRQPAPPTPRAAYDQSVFQDQLAELERDVARGILPPAEADAARLEIQRRMLAATRAPDPAPARESSAARSLLTAGVAVVVPFLALGLYFDLGAPQLGLRGQTAGHAEGDMAALVEKLSATVREHPEDPRGWALLARSYRQLGNFDAAADAYRHLMALTPEDPEAYAGFGEAATAASDGTVTADAHAAFMHALKLDRDDPRAQFYLGLEQAQQGHATEAIAIWRALTAAAPAGAQWLDTVRSQMAEVAQDAGIMPMSVTPRHALEVLANDAPQTADATAQEAPAVQPSADAPDVSALKGRFSPDQLSMIQGMVSGLAARLQANPGDYDGWMRLGRAYTVLQNAKGARDAYAHAVALRPQELAPKVQLADLTLAAGDTEGPLPADLLRLGGDIHRLDANAPEGLFILGLAKAGSKDTAAARELWERAERSAPQDSPLAREIAQRLAALK
jgi:cytochrome c-type biogenesis protein CcmH